MARYHDCIFILLAFLGMVLFAGCVTEEDTGPFTETPDHTPVLTPPEGIPETIPSSVVTIPAPSLSPTDGKDQHFAEPFVSVNGIKRTTYSIPNCTMGQLVPAVNEAGYGLNSIKEARLHFMSAGDFSKVIREYTENKDAFSVCYGVPETPYWGFVNVIGTLTARNSRPALYNISMIVIFRGSEGPAYHTEMILNPGQEYPYSIYIPIKVDQIQSIEGITFSFDQMN